MNMVKSDPAETGTSIGAMQRCQIWLVVLAVHQTPDRRGTLVIGQRTEAFWKVGTRPTSPMDPWTVSDRSQLVMFLSISPSS